MILTPYSDMSPVPRIHMRLDGLNATADRVTVAEVGPGGERVVRGGYRVPATSVIVLDDFLAPLNRPVRYRVQQLDAAGGVLAEDEYTSAQIIYHGTVVQHIIDPYRSTEARLLVGSEDKLEWEHDGSMVRPGNARMPTWVGSGRWPLQGIPLKLGTDTAEQEAAMRMVLGIDLVGDEDSLPIIALRTSHPVRFPQPLQAVVKAPSARGLDWISGGSLTHWTMTADEVRPPGAALVRAAITWADLMASAPTWASVASSYPTWADVMTDYSLAGLSNAA